VSVGGGGGVGVAVGGGGVGVSVGGSGVGGVGVSIGETISGITGLTGTEVTALVGTRVCSKASTRLGVLVGVGVTRLVTPGPQAKMGARNIIKAPGSSIKNLLIKTKTLI
jgi:hypothetical protein